MKKKKVIAWIMAAAMTFSPAVTYADLTVESQNAAPPSETVQTIADEETIYELGDTDEATTNEEPVYELGTPDADEEVVYELGDPDVQVADESTATVLSKNADSNSTGMAEVIMEDGSAATYSDVQSLVNTVASYSGKTFTIKLYSNISTADAGMFKIPSSSKVTLDLNGYSINRHKANASYDTDDDYEVVIVYENADLTIIDSDPKRYHGGYLDGSKGRKIWFENDGSTAMPIYGGVIAGGASENGAGGITIKNNATVTMKGGTIAGNVAGSGTFSYNGGGGVQLRNSGSKFILDGGRIMYNGAYKNNGGGIDNEEGVVELISGDVSYNWAYGGATNRHGGGIYINHESDRALYIHGSNTSEGNEEKRSVNICNNYSEDEGGGIYFNAYGNGCGISGCEVTNNKAKRNGGGIHLYDTVAIGGKMIVKNNSADDGRNNLYNYGYITDPNLKITDLSYDSELYIHSDWDNDEVITEGTTIGSAKGMFGEGNYHFEKINDPTSSNYRKIVQKSGKAEPQKPEEINAWGSVNKEQTATATNLGYTMQIDKSKGDVNGAPVYRGYLRFADAMKSIEGYYHTMNYYYSDGLFFTDPTDYNKHLASLTASLAMASGAASKGITTVLDPATQTNRFNYLTQVFSDIGCTNESMYVNKSDIVTYVGPNEMGLKRYGVDHYLPGGEAGKVKKTTKTYGPLDKQLTIYSDNSDYEVNYSSSDYMQLRKKFIGQLAAIMPDFEFNDYFSAAEVNYFWGNEYTSWVPILGEDMITEAEYAPLSTKAKFCQQFWARLLRYSSNTQNAGHNITSTTSSKDYREFYANNKNGHFMEGSRYHQQGCVSLQEALSTVIGIAMGGEKELDLSNMVDLTGAAADIALDAYDELIGDLYDDNTPQEYTEWIDKIWGILTNDLTDEQRGKGYKNLKDILGDDIEKANAVYPTLLAMTLDLVNDDYNDTSKGQYLLGTLAYNANDIINDHLVNIAWIRADDDWYAGDVDKVYAMNIEASVPDKPGAWLSAAEKGKAETAITEGTTAEASTTQKLYLRTQPGGAVYYTMKVNGEETASDVLYQGAEGITLPADKTVEITTYAKAYEQKSDEAIYTVKVAPRIAISKANVTGINAKYVYSGKLKKPAPVVKYKGKKLIKGTDYTVAYRNNKKVGTAKVIITGKGKYTGKTTKTFKIIPKGTSIKKLQGSKKAISVTWKKQSTKMSASHITGYQIQVATNNKFTKGKKTVSVKGFGKTSTKITKLKAKKKYWVRIRTYKKVGGKTYYSKWSKAKTVKTK